MLFSQRAFLVDLRVANLQIPEAGDQKQKNGDGGVLENRDLLRGELRIVAQQRVARSFDRLRGRREVSQMHPEDLAGYFQFIQNAEQRQGHRRIQ